MLDSDRYIIDVDQLDFSVGGANCNSATPTIAPASKDLYKPSTSDHMTLVSDHMIPVKDHVTTPRSGGDIIKLLRMTSSTDHMTSSTNHMTSSIDHMTCPVAVNNTASK